MKCLALFALFALASSPCAFAETDDTDTVVAKLGPLWLNGIYQPIPFPADAPVWILTEKIIETQYPHLVGYKKTKTKKLQLFDVPPQNKPYTAICVTAETGSRLVILARCEGKNSWWFRVYPVYTAPPAYSVSLDPQGNVSVLDSSMK